MTRHAAVPAPPHAMITITAPLARALLAEAEAALDAIGNPPEALAAALGTLDDDGLSGTHFMSAHAFASTDGEGAWLLLELSADGTPDAAIARLARVPAVAEALAGVFALASDWRDGADIGAYLKSHIARSGAGLFDPPGLVFAGAPGMSVGRIRREAALAARAASVLRARKDSAPARVQLAEVRAALRGDTVFAPALVPTEPEPGFIPVSRLKAVAGVLLALARAFLWPVGVAVLVYAAISAIRFAQIAGAAHFFDAFVHALIGGAMVAVILVLAALAVGYVAFRAQESRDPAIDRAPDHRLNAAMFERENRGAQDHMISITRRKPGMLRMLTIRLTFTAIGALVGRVYRPGFLGPIGTIHFARWMTPPGSRDLVFLSNFDGSWESYLEDFITLAHAGLTGAWSNSIGFPRTRNLVQQGATDGERFKRFARASMIPSRVWYSAYPELTVAVIRRNAAIARGIANAGTEDEAKDWLSLFGSIARPVSKLMSSEIQSLVFGGMNFMPFGTCLIFADLPDDRAASRAGLSALLPLVAFNDGRLDDKPARVTLALGAGGLRRLGLDEDAVASFPFAFVEGMTGASRSRILGDVAANAPAGWDWGRAAPDLAMLVYGKTQGDVDALVAEIGTRAGATGIATPHPIALCPVSDDKREPFGFLDGVSQPVIRGTYKSLRQPDPIHLCEPGEFVLGYPDNRGNLPPGPVLPASEDPEGMLPLVGRALGSAPDFAGANAADPRDLGFNGSFLVIRQLEQDVAGFDAYCAAEADRLAGRLSAPYVVDADFVAAKLVGRWQDGSSLVRNMYTPETRPRGSVTGRATVRARPQVAAGEHPVEQPTELAPEVGNTRSDRDVDGDRRPTRADADNNFLFGTEDPEGLRCPYGAHIRRANPRESQNPGSQDQIAISNRHRIARVGRRYQPTEAGGKAGLLFMCIAGDIERQFEFLQQTWLGSPSFHGLSCEKDPLLGDAETGRCGYTIPSREGPLMLNPLPRFVTTRGGGYFFLPGKRLLEYLAGPPLAA